MLCIRNSLVILEDLLHRVWPEYLHFDFGINSILFFNGDFREKAALNSCVLVIIQLVSRWSKSVHTIKNGSWVSRCSLSSLPQGQAFRFDSLSASRNSALSKQPSLLNFLRSLVTKLVIFLNAASR